MSSGVTSEALAKLREPFPAADIEWRVQQAGKKRDGGYYAMVLAYVTNRAIMERLDEICGPENWRNEFRKAPEGGILCGLSVRVGDEWITKWDGAANTDIEAVKGGLSGAMKRAGVQWGIGRYLYNLDEDWARIHDRGSQRFSGNVNVSGGKKERATFKWDPPVLPDEFLPASERGRSAQGQRPQPPAQQQQPPARQPQQQRQQPRRTSQEQQAPAGQEDPACVRAQAEMAIDACTSVQQLETYWKREGGRFEALGIANDVVAYCREAKNRLIGGNGSGSAAEDGDAPKPWSEAQRKAIMAHYSKKGWGREERLADMADFLGREIDSFNALTAAEASQFIDALNNPPA